MNKFIYQQERNCLLNEKKNGYQRKVTKVCSILFLLR